MEFKPKRANSTEFPDTKEIDVLLEREAKRPVPPEKQDFHFADFTVARKWLAQLELPSTIFDTSCDDIKKIAAEISELQSQVTSKMIELSQTNPDSIKDIVQEVTQYLGEEDIPQPTDLIFVFGGSNLGRIETAVDLYKKQLAPKIFISGGAPIYKPNQISEAIIFRDWAIEHGVPDDDIAIHDTALSIADNVRGGLNVLDEIGLKHDSMTLVITWFAMRRATSVMMKYIPEETKLYRVNAAVDSTSDYAPDNWWKNEVGIKTVFNEFAKLKASELLGSS